MSPAYAKNEARLARGMDKQVQKIMRGTMDAETALNRTGLFLQREIQKEIDEKETPPNAPATIARKNSSKPLIDSGQMRQAVTYKVHM